ncbi:MAG: T9SS type A sorting domain-containing protein [Flavobacteriia bacterium]
MRYLLVLIIISAIQFTGFSQLEKVIVEKYYVSDLNDATDTLGGGLPIGSTTYRIYVDLAPGSVLKKIYGDANHPFSIQSTAPFFNHESDGQTFAKDFVKNRYLEGTVALDTWLTLGQTTKTQAGKTYVGVLKNQDVDGSFIGGVNNDGGSELISTGLLINNDANAGIPLTQADGMDTIATIPSSWSHFGVLDFITGNDSTIFGSLTSTNEFLSDNFNLTNSGIKGLISDSNQILVAQLTTTGDISFHLNLEIDAIINGSVQSISYVSSINNLQPGESFSNKLIYPPTCGCNNPEYLEFDPAVVCLEPGTCITLANIGCLDTLACNYDPTVNVSMPNLCCYPGKCNNRDIAIVCPALRGENFEFLVYPNPSAGDFYLDVYSGMSNEAIQVEVFNTFGVKVYEHSFAPTGLLIGEKLEWTMTEKGLYHIKVQIGEQVQTQLLFKN